VELELEGAIEPEPITLDAESLSRQYLAERLDIQSLIKQIEIVKNSRDATIAGMTPSVALTLSFDPSFQKDPFEDAWFEDVEDDWKQRSGMFGVTVSVPLDKLLPFSKTWVELANTKDNIKKMRLNLTQAMRGAEMEVKTIVMNLKKSLESIESLEMNVELAKRAYNMAEEAYNAGNRELLEVQQAEDELKKARLEVLREQYNYTTGLLDLEYALNTSLEEIKEKYHE
jgi:outer membrane protein TolC